MEYIEALIARYRHKGLLIDTNLLLLYFVGKNDPERIPRFKRTMAFTIPEFWLLEHFFDVFDKVITTPNVLTEVSNLLGGLPENLHSSFFSDFGTRIPSLEEHYTSSTSISSSTHFNQFGLTDCGIVELVKDNYLVLTDDLPLAGYLENRNIDVINFNHLRTFVW
jgi:hypothetical protein